MASLNSKSLWGKSYPMKDAYQNVCDNKEYRKCLDDHAKAYEETMGVRGNKWMGQTFTEDLTKKT